MMRGLITLSSLALVAGCMALPPQGIEEERRAAYVAAVSSIGCVLHGESDYLPVELQAGLTREEAIQMTQYHLANGSAVKMSDGSVKLVTGGCAENAETPAS